MNAEEYDSWISCNKVSMFRLECICWLSLMYCVSANTSLMNLISEMVALSEASCDTTP